MTTLPSPTKHAQIIRLKPFSLTEYKRVHASVWPSVLLAIHRANIREYSIFYAESLGILFATFTYVGKDFEGDMERMKGDEETWEWWRLTDGMQTSLVDGATGSASGPPWWQNLEGVFYFKGDVAPDVDRAAETGGEKDEEEEEQEDR